MTNAALTFEDHRQHRGGRARRGVIMLVVMGFLVLLTMVAVTYVVASREFKTSARAATAGERYDSGFEELLDRAFKQLVRGTHNPFSAARIHNLLEDGYGNDGVLLNVTGASWFPSNNPGEQVFLVLNVQHPGGPQPPLVQRSGYYNGRVVTFTSGPARNVSGRITGYQAGSGSDGTLWMLPLSKPVGFSGTYLATPPQMTNVLINGRPFNGAGFGLDIASKTVVHPQGAPPHQKWAFLPNVGYGRTDIDDASNLATPGGFAIGGADEDYDIPDYNNIHLAARVWNPSANSGAGRWEVQSPSFYDAALAHWHRVNNPDYATPAVKRQIVFRPLSEYHAQFTGSNPNHNALNNLNVGSAGTAPNPLLWDVDNDGDGVPDSVWIDLGMPVQTAPDGRQYKPLYAVMILDMDSRLNLSVHGQRNHFFRGTPGPDQILGSPLMAGNNTSVNAMLPYGDGRGPTEVNPLWLLDQNTYERVLFGQGGNIASGIPRLHGRYGERQVYSSGTSYPAPGLSDGIRDPLDVIKNFSLPTSLSALAWSDWDGDAIIGLDKHGAPLRDRSLAIAISSNAMGNPALLAEELQHPWQFDPYRTRYLQQAGGRTTVDAPFTMAELERVLRPNDVDSSSLPHRLQYLLSGAYTAKLGGQVTAESYSIPTPAIRPNEELREEIDQQTLAPTDPRRLGMLDFLDFVAYKILADAREGGYAAPNIDQSIASLIPVDLANGLRWNINHPIGNYQDDNNDNSGRFANPGATRDLIDELGESHGGEAVWRQAVPFDTPPPPGFNGITMDHGNDGRTDEFKRRHPRQMYARYLYCLMMMLKDHGYNFPIHPAETVNADRYTAHRLAQWAVNVVDFIDDDHAMTYFEFDYEPFRDNNGDGDPWDVDGYLATRPDGTPSTDDNAGYRGVVWGVERPDLLLTETLAMHEFRTEDLPDDESNRSIPPPGIPYDPNTHDNDLDQRRMPQGSLFLELRNPWHDRGYDLSALAPQSTNGYRYPHFQLAIAPPLPVNPYNAPDTGHIDPTMPSFAQAERIVWFTNRAIYPNNDDPNLLISDKIYLSDLQPFDNSLPPVQQDFYNKVTYGNGAAAAGGMFNIGPGQYSVIGPRVTTRIGFSGTGGTKLGAITIRLVDENSPAPPSGPENVTFGVNNQLVSNTDSIGYPNWQGASQRIKVPQGIVINHPRPLSISEPGPGEMYYPAPNATTQDPDDPAIQWPDAYSPAKDTPLDPLTLRQRGTQKAYRFVYLQRLANPDRPWNPDTNPYITIDFAPIDLHVYNGEIADSAPDPDDPGPQPAAGGMVNVGAKAPLQFRTRERNGLSHNIWQQTFTDPGDRARHNFRHSLGHLNGLIEGIGSGETQAIFATNGVWDVNDGVPAAYIGDPRTPAFPWMHIKNAPLASPMELLHVPASSPSRLLLEFGVRRGSFTNHYRDRQADNSVGPPYSHLLNFFSSSDAGSAQTRSNFYRLFEFIHVPSKFAGSEQILNPTLFSGGGPGHHYHPPFNRVSMFRDAGRFNVNTMFDDGGLWSAAFDQNLGTGVNNHWQHVWQSRQGYAGGGPGSLRLNDNSPTFFANPFRQYGADYDVPIPALRQRDLTGAVREKIESTLMRADPQLPTKPLLAAMTSDEVGATAPFGYASDDYVDGNRSPYFRFQPLNQASNALTTTSNVYGIWVTVGFFEASPVPRSLDYPDGYTYGQELGADTGDIVRHRAFYIYDRSIPVGFMRGEDLNTEQGVLVRKIIE